MGLVIDNREVDIIINCKKLGIPFTVEQLKIGDITNGIVCIERKTTSDFVASMIDGRLTEQITYMQEYAKPIVIIEGSWQGLESHMNMNAILGMIAAIAARTNVSFMHTDNSMETAYLAAKICEKSTDGKSFNHKDVIRKDIPLDLAMLCLVPKISLIKAEKLLAHYKFQDIIRLEKDKLRAIDGIGETLANNIIEFQKWFK